MSDAKDQAQDKTAPGATAPAEESKLSPELEKLFASMIDRLTGKTTPPATSDLHEILKGIGKLGKLIGEMEHLEVLGNLKLNDIRDAIADRMDLDATEKLHHKLFDVIQESGNRTCDKMGALLSLILYYVNKHTKVEVVTARNRDEMAAKIKEHTGKGRHVTHLEVTGGIVDTLDQTTKFGNNTNIVGDPNPVLKA